MTNIMTCDATHADHRSHGKVCCPQWQHHEAVLNKTADITTVCVQITHHHIS